VSRKHGPRVLARMDACLAVLRHSDAPMRCLDIAPLAGIVTGNGYALYAETYVALRNLERVGLAERVSGRDLPLAQVTLTDGRVVEMPPDLNAVGWRAAAVDAEALAALEAMWALPPAEVDRA
jgi:hypothetical protein